MKKKLFIISATVLLLATACKKDDKKNTVAPPRDVTEVRNENNAAIEKFLKTHTYTFTPTTSISEMVTFATTSNTAESILENPNLQKMELDVLDANNKRVRHSLYYIILQQGTGTTTTIADSVYVNYKGQLLDLSTFEETKTQSMSNWFDLIGDVTNSSKSGAIKGFREGLSKLRASSSSRLMPNTDGTNTVPTDGGMAILFIPSGLGYFNNTQSKIPAYSPLIFSVNLISTKRADHDHDGKPSINEIERDNYGIITYPDCDASKDRTPLPDYLDSDCK
jgi:peptidylprolyl isomerase FKBP-type